MSDIMFSSSLLQLDGFIWIQYKHNQEVIITVLVYANDNSVGTILITLQTTPPIINYSTLMFNFYNCV